MSDDEIGGELDRVLRVALTASGQFAERLARSRADADRTRHAATADAQREAERQLARQIEAGRAVYGAVREPQLWEQPNAQRRLGEALVAAEALQDADPVATPAAQYIRTEARRRQGPDSDGWLAEAVQSYIDDMNERGVPYNSATYQARASQLHQAEQWAKTDAPKVWDTYGSDLMGSDSPDGRRSAENHLIASWRTAVAEGGNGAIHPGSEAAPAASEAAAAAPGSEAAVAAQAFPVSAAADLNSPHRQRRAPAARKSSSRVQQRDRAR